MSKCGYNALPAFFQSPSNPVLLPFPQRILRVHSGLSAYYTLLFSLYLTFVNPFRTQFKGPPLRGILRSYYYSPVYLENASQLFLYLL